MLKIWLVGVVFCLLIHLGAGHSAEYIANDFIGGAIILIGGISAIFLLRMATQIRKVPNHIYERNRQASLLARKVNKRKELTADEYSKLDSFLKKGVLSAKPYVYKNAWFLKVKLTDSALNEILHY